MRKLYNISYYSLTVYCGIRNERNKRNPVLYLKLVWRGGSQTSVRGHSWDDGILSVFLNGRDLWVYSRMQISVSLKKLNCYIERNRFQECKQTIGM